MIQNRIVVSNIHTLVIINKYFKIELFPHRPAAKSYYCSSKKRFHYFPRAHVRFQHFANVHWSAEEKIWWVFILSNLNIIAFWGCGKLNVWYAFPGCENHTPKMSIWLPWSYILQVCFSKNRLQNVHYDSLWWQFRSK